MSKKNEHKPNVPELRFPEFSGEWEEKRLGEDFKIIDGDRGDNYPTSEELFTAGYCVFLNAGNVTKTGMKFDKVYFISKQKDELLRNGKVKLKDLIITTRGTVGNVGYVNNAIPYKHMRINSGMVILRNPNISLFVYHLLHSSVLSKFLNRITVKSAQPHLTKKSLEKMYYNISPHSEERQKISDFFSKLDRQIELEEKKLALLEEQKKGYMQKIFSQELRFKNENGNEYPEWEEKRLGEIAEVIMGQSPKSKNYTKDSSFMVLVQGNADLNNGKVYPRLFTKKKTKITNTNDILLTVRAPVGEIGISQFPVVIGRGVCSIKGSKFIYFYLKYLKEVNWWSKISQGSTFESISGKDIRELIVWLPSDKNEQYKITQILNKLDSKVIKIKRKIVLLEESKNTLLSKVFI